MRENSCEYYYHTSQLLTGRHNGKYVTTSQNLTFYWNCFFYLNYIPILALHCCIISRIITKPPNNWRVKWITGMTGYLGVALNEQKHKSMATIIV